MSFLRLFARIDSTVFVGGFCAIISGVFPVDIVGETTSISALITYLFVHIEVIVVSAIDFSLIEQY